MIRERSRRQPSRWPVFVSLAVSCLALLSAVMSIASAKSVMRQLENLNTDGARMPSAQPASAIEAPRLVAPGAMRVSSPDAYQVQRGWVARVLKATSRFGDGDADDNLGVFVLDEFEFTMNQHRLHGIELDHSVVYQLDGIYQADRQGTHQLVVEFRVERLAAADDRQSGDLKRMPVCYAQTSISGQKTFTGRANFEKHDLPKIDVMGNAVLTRGLHPISLRLFCDSAATGPDVTIAFKARAPDSMFLNNRDAGIVHLAPPPKLITESRFEDTPKSEPKQEVNGRYFYASR